MFTIKVVVRTTGKQAYCKKLSVWFDGILAGFTKNQCNDRNGEARLFYDNARLSGLLSVVTTTLLLRNRNNVPNNYNKPACASLHRLFPQQQRLPARPHLLQRLVPVTNGRQRFRMCVRRNFRAFRFYSERNVNFAELSATAQRLVLND